MDDRRGPGRSLEILRVKERLDAYFRAGESAKAEALLRYWEAETRASGDRRGLLEILSEEIGFFRDPDEADSAIACAREAAEIVYGEKMEEGVSGATILLNAATTENAFGDKQRARSLFGQAKRVLERELPAGDKRLAGLYNNMASLYSEEDPERALAYFEKALAVLSAQDVPDCEAAVTYVNMAALLHTRDPLDERIPAYMDRAAAVLDDPAVSRAYPYSYTCAKCAPVFGFFGYFLYEKELRERQKQLERAEASRR